MIVKASDALRRAVFKVQKDPKDIELAPLPGAVPPPTVDLSNLLPIMPDWFKALLIDGSLLILDRTEYSDLPEEIKDHVEVISR